MCGVCSPREQRLPFPVRGVAHHMSNDWIQLVAYVTAPIYTLSGSNMHRKVGTEVVALLSVGEQRRSERDIPIELFKRERFVTVLYFGGMHSN